MHLFVKLNILDKRQLFVDSFAYIARKIKRLA